MSFAALRDRILADTSLEPAGNLVPEIRLHLATTPREILREPAGHSVRRDEPPYWAFAWPGGQALARFLLDNPSIVAGRRVLDIGAGSAIGTIAALLAGARYGTANDIDPVAVEAAKLNAESNSVAIQVSNDDLLDCEPSADLLLIGDLVYQPRLEQRVAALLRSAGLCGVPVLFGDRATSPLPAFPFQQVAQYDTIVAPPLEEGWVEVARVWRLDPA